MSQFNNKLHAEITSSNALSFDKSFIILKANFFLFFNEKKKVYPRKIFH